jgi:hypothetical protein
MLKKLTGACVGLAMTAVSLVTLPICPSKAAVVIEITESGPDVLLEYSGNLDLTGVPYGFGPATDWNADINPPINVLRSNSSLVDYDFYDLDSTFSSYGSGPRTFGTPNGSTFSVQQGYVGVREGYVSGEQILGGLSFADNSLIAMGLSSGVYTATLASGDSIQLRIGQLPLPSSLVLFGSALAGVSFLGLRRRRPRPLLQLAGTTGCSV